MIADDLKNIQMEIKAIELEEVKIHFPPLTTETNLEIKFPVTYSLKFDRGQEIIIVGVNVKILLPNKPDWEGSLIVNYIFNAPGIAKVVAENKDEEELVKFVKKELTEIVTSTTRGIMFSTFRGTALHNAILPIGQFTEI